MKILFIIFSTTTGFFTGALAGSALISKNSGLAGGASVLMYGTAGLVILLILAVVLMNKIKPVTLKKVTIVLILFNIIYIIWIVVRVQSTINDGDPNKKIPQEKTDTVVASASFFYTQQNEQSEIGLGMAAPDFYNKRQLYFYSKPNFGKPVQDHTPVDSIVFSQTEHHQYDITYAPPWFYPEHLKLDYDILYLKILSMNRDWLEVETNKKDWRSMWISQYEVTVYFWPEFLLNVFSIENPDPIKNPLRVKPLLHASEVLTKDYEFMKPLLIKDNWLWVSLMDNDFNSTGEGWIRWASDEKLLVSYSLLL